MSGNNRWVLVLAARVIVHAVVGALVCAVAGGLLGALSAWPIELTEFSSIHFMLPFAPRVIWVDIITAVAIWGAVLAAGVGAVTTGVIGLLRPPYSPFLPPPTLLKTTLVGMALSTLGAFLSLTVLSGFQAAIGHIPLREAMWNHLFLYLYGIPVLTLGGLIGGAIRGLLQERKLLEGSR